jgi:hypothetical protein
MASRGMALALVALLAGTLFTAGMQSSALAQTENLFCDRPLSSYARVIEGTQGDDALEGTPGDDLIRGFAGNDSIYGKAGNDCLKGGEGDDRMWGGEGDDAMYGHEGDDKLVGDGGSDIAFGGDGGDEMWGNAGDDRLVGESGSDSIHGDGGSDKLYGNDGEDLVWGGEGDDTAAGGEGDDRAIGDGGNDRMWGGEGDDKLLGMAGDDGLVGDAGSDRMYGHEGIDQLYDDLGDDGLNGGDGIDGCYDIVGANIIFNCEEPGSKDQQGDSAFKDFDIKNYGIDENGETYVEVYGEAGRTLPSGEKTIFAYVIQTDTGTYASDSHEAQHADDEVTANLSWHGHLIVLDAQGCIEEVDGFKSKAHLDGDRVVITDTESAQVLKVQTVRLELQVDDPDNPPPGVTCIAKVVEVFDEAAG